jgi:DNA-binding transcriptional ArsR family regulator
VSLAVLPHIPAEWIILDLLMDAEEQGLSVSELVQAIGSPAAVAEALDALYAAGLVSRVGQFVVVATTPIQTRQAPAK